MGRSPLELTMGDVVVEKQVDGRTARRDRNYQAVLDAVVALFIEGDPAPSPEAVAERSGVSRRSVYRYLNDRDEMIRVGIQHHLRRAAPLFAVEGLGQGELAQRVQRLLSARLRGYQALAATARVARARAVQSDVLRHELEAARRFLRRQTEQQFAPELRRLPAAGRRAVLDAVDNLTQVPSLAYQVEELGRSPKVVQRDLTVVLTRLLEPA